MSDVPGNAPRVSRRMWLAGLSGGALSLPFLWWFDVLGRSRRAADSRRTEAPCCVYVDRDGWMLAPEDVAALAARPPAQ